MAALGTYRPDIDGMRAVAVLSVVAYHYGLGMGGGYIGVDVFFVISGFLIGSLIYHDALEHRFSYLAFYARRVRRIVPALLAVLAATFLAMLMLATPQEMRDFGATATATVLSASNIELWRSIGYFRPTAELNPLLMTWSLGVEEQFYLLAPLALLLLPRWRLRWRIAALAGLIVASLALATWGMWNEADATFFLLPTRAWELGAGVLLGVLDVHRARSAPAGGTARGLDLRAGAGLLLILAPAFFYSTLTPFPGLTAVPPVLGTVLLLGSGASAINRRLLAAPAMRFFGLISYSLYLWHWPLISLTRMVRVHEPSLLLRLGLLICAIALAWVSYRFIEQPLRRGRTPARSTLWRYAGAMALVALVTGSAFAMDGYPQRWPAGFAARIAGAEHGLDPCLTLTGPQPRLSAHCYPRGRDQRLIALVGDSHAAALAPGVRALAARGGMGLAQLTKASCPFLLGVSRKVSKQPRHMGDCAAFDRKVLQLVQQDERIGTVIIAGAWRAGSMRDASYAPTSGPDGSPGELLERGLSAAVLALRRSGKRVLIVRDVPFVQFLPAKRLAACASPLRAALNGRRDDLGCDFVAGQEMEPDGPALAVLDRTARETGAMLIDPHAALCGTQGCRIALDGQPLYEDQQHLTDTGSALVSGVFASALGIAGNAVSSRTAARMAAQ